jgi:hypothetical protein
LKRQALSFTPPPGMVGVYAIRPFAITNATVWFQMSLDRHKFGPLGASSCLFGLAPPGIHVLHMTVRHGAAESFTAGAGTNYFFTVTPGLAGPPD